MLISQFWSLRSPCSRHWQTWCLVRTHSLLQTAVFLLCSHTGFPGGASAGDVRDAVSTPGLGRSLEEEMATHSSILLGESHEQRSLGGYSPWGHTESDSTWSHLAQTHMGSTLARLCEKSTGVGESSESTVWGGWGQGISEVRMVGEVISLGQRALKGHSSLGSFFFLMYLFLTGG